MDRLLFMLWRAGDDVNKPWSLESLTSLLLTAGVEDLSMSTNDVYLMETSTCLGEQLLIG